MNKKLGFGALLLAAACYGSFGVWIRLLSREMGTYEQIVFRNIIAFGFGRAYGYLTQEIRQHNIESVQVGSDGLEVHVNQFDRRLSFSDRTEASVWYVAGSQVDDKHYDRKVTISPHGPIHEVKLLISSAQRTWARDAQHIEGASNWLTMRLGDNGQWLPADMSDKWARHMSTTGETLENGDVRVQMKVFDEVKEIILPKIDLNTVLDTSQNLVNAIVNGK